MAKKPVDLAYAFDLPPQEALKYFTDKGYILPKKLSEGWQEVWQEAHSKAFTVARVTRMDVLDDIRGMVTKSLEEGITFEQFKKELMPKLQKKGWWGIVQDEEGNDVQLGSVRRLKTIYDTNLRTSYMAGRYKDMYLNAKNRPYWMYDAKEDGRTRPAHKALDGVVYRYDHPFWDTHYPPNGWRCRCNVLPLTEGEVQEKGLTVKTEMPSRSATDVGWDYNVGKAAFQPDLEKYDYRVAKQYCEGVVTGEPFKHFFSQTQKTSLAEIQKAPQNFPVAVLSPGSKKLLDSNSQVVFLSNETLRKNIDKHPEIHLEEYFNIPNIVDKAEVITKEGDNKLIFLKEGDKYKLAIIKATQDKKESYLVTYYDTDEREVKRRLKKGEVIKNELN
jgi:SPP1 gp7 family putative phage head morphogenesis protein